MFEAGGIHVERRPHGQPGSPGLMVADAPEFAERAAAYNALADSHGPEPRT